MQIQTSSTFSVVKVAAQCFVIGHSAYWQAQDNGESAKNGRKRQSSYRHYDLLNSKETRAVTTSKRSIGRDFKEVSTKQSIAGSSVGIIYSRATESSQRE